MNTHPDPYATEAETDALLAADTRTPAERRLAALFDARGGNEQGAEPEAVLRGIALELIEREQADRHELQAQGKHPAPCARFCEATAFGIKIRDLEAQLRAALAAPQPAGVSTESLVPVIQWLEAGCDPKHAATELRLLSKAVSQPAQEPVEQNVGMYVEVRECHNCTHIGINDSCSDSACTECEWSGPSPAEDLCPGCGKKGSMTSACPECGHRTHLLASATLTTPQAPQRQPLTDEQINAIFEAIPMDEYDGVLSIARAIEAAHGITKGPAA